MSIAAHLKSLCDALALALISALCHSIEVSEEPARLSRSAMF